VVCPYVFLFFGGSLKLRYFLGATSASVAVVEVEGEWVKAEVDVKVGEDECEEMEVWL
jgi:hypothetical protein